MDAVVVFFVAPAVAALGLPASTFFGAAAAFLVAVGFEAGVAFEAGFFAVVDLAAAAVFEGGLEFYKRQHEINMSAPDKGGGPE